MKQTILVTGAAGFIGSHTADALLLQGHRVVGLDNFNDYYDPQRKRRNVQEVKAQAKRAERADYFEMVEGDIRDVALVRNLFDRHRFDAVVHLAAMAGVRASMDNPELYLDVNLNGTLVLLNATRDFSVGNFVLASTSSVYGNTQQVPFVETDSADRPLAPYPASKRAAELLCYSYHHLYKLSINVLRFFTVYGPRGRPDMMAYKVLNNIFFGDEVPLYNGGNMHRDWTYVQDIVSGVTAAAQKQLGFEVINLGRGEPVLLADFVHSIEELAGKKSKLKEEPMMSADIAYTYADISKAQKLLEYHPRTSVQQGVREFWAWYQQSVLER
jgi:UDP-glucuronate 4-epimerase